MTKSAQSGSHKGSNPYVGPRALKEEDGIYGRERELDQLFNRVIARRVVMLHSPSGAGKSSLVQAGLVPLLQEEDFEVFPVIRVNEEPPDSYSGNRYLRSMKLGLHDYFSNGDLRPKNGSNPFLIFDQFEEIMTVEPINLEAKTEFFAQVGRLLDNPEVWALFVMRDEYMGPLEPYRHLVPTGFAYSFRLDLLERKAASKAIAEPARRAGIPFSGEAVEELVRDLATVQVQQADGSYDPDLGPHVEPVQLQVVCLRLWDGLPVGVREIGQGHLRKAGDVDQALSDYYRVKVEEVAGQDKGLQRLVREWFGEQLIKNGIRSQVRKEKGRSEQLDNAIIGKLIKSHLVRADRRVGTGVTWFELAHDRLIKPIQDSNERWFKKNLQLFQHRTIQWVKDGKPFPSDQFLGGEELRQANAWVRSHHALVRPDEKDLIDKSKRHRKTRHIWIITVVVGLVLSMAAALYMYILKDIADERAQLAISRRLMTWSSANSSEFDLPALLASHAHIHVYPDVQTRANLFRILQRPSPQLWKTLRGHDKEVFKVAWSPNPEGRIIASASQDGIVLWDVGSQNTKRLRNESDVRLLAWDPTGDRLAFAGTTGKVVIWNTQPCYLSFQDPLCGQESELSDPVSGNQAHSGNVNALAWHPSDGSRLASAGGDGLIKVWQVDPPELLHNPLGHDEAVACLAWSPTGRYLASGGLDGKLRFWDASGNALGSSDEGSALTSVVWDPQSGLASATINGRVRVWATVGAAPPYGIVFETDVGKGDKFLAWSSRTSGSEKTLALVDGKGAVRVIYPPEASPEVLQANALQSLIWSPDGRTIAYSDSSSVIQLWSPTTGYRADLIGHESGGPDSGEAVKSLSWSPDGLTLASASVDRTIKLWRTGRRAETTLWPEAAFRRRKLPSLVVGLDWLSNGQGLVSAGSDGPVLIWDAELVGTPEQLSHQPPPYVRSMVRHPNLGSASKTGYRIALATRFGRVEVMEPQNRRLLWSWKADDREVFLSWNPDGRVLASGSRSGDVKLWDLSSSLESPPDEGPGTPLVILSQPSQILSLAWSRQGVLGTGFDDGSIKLWSALESVIEDFLQRGNASAESIQHPFLPLDGHGEGKQVTRLAWSLDGRLLASGDSAGVVRLWEVLPSGSRMLREFAAHSAEVTAIAWTGPPAGGSLQTLATGSNDKSVKIWEPRSGQLENILSLEGEVTGLAWSLQGPVLLAAAHTRPAGLGGTITVWDLDESKWLRRAEEIVMRNMSCQEWERFFEAASYHKTFEALPPGCPSNGSAGVTGK